MKRWLNWIAVFSLALGSTLAHASEDSKNPRVLMSTSMGDIVLELYPDKAPKTVENFLRYVKDGFYEGTIFHRVIDGFMIQGGGFTPDMTMKKPRPPIMNEADNGLRNKVGTIAMARTMDPHSASSQFFINVANNPNLDFREKRPRAWGYAVFGRVVKGMDVVKKIKSVPTTTKGPYRDVPAEPVTIEKMTLLTKSESHDQTAD
jgi:peptidyl-prolyl cis-trans isomerase B (cyclophilin B)